MKRFLNAIDSVGKWSGQITAPFALLYTGIIIFEIIARYFFNAPTIWAHETRVFIFGGQFMAAGAYCFWRGSFVNVEVLYDWLPLRIRTAVDLVLFAIPLGICIIMIWKGWGFFWESFRALETTHTVFAPPLYILRAMIPFSAFLLLTQLVGKFIRDLHIAFTGRQFK